MPEVLIVGASRGIGLGLVREFVERGWAVTATVRDAAKGGDLQALGATVEAVDVADAGSRAALVERLGGRVFDAIILNAGVAGPRRMGGADDELLDVLHANAVGPTQLAWALRNAVKPDIGVLAFTTSMMGSIADNASGGADTYRASKAALNTYARSFELRHRAEDFGVVLMHPGWVRTEMGGAEADLDVETSATGMADVIEGRLGSKGCVYLDHAGQTLAW